MRSVPFSHEFCLLGCQTISVGIDPGVSEDSGIFSVFVRQARETSDLW